jgi:hypothetical protein
MSQVTLEKQKKINSTTSFSVRVENDLKNDFLSTAEKMGINGGMIIRQFMRDFTKKQKSIASLSIDDAYLDELLRSPSIRKKMEKLSDALTSVGF